MSLYTTAVAPNQCPPPQSQFNFPALKRSGSKRSRSWRSSSGHGSPDRSMFAPNGSRSFGARLKLPFWGSHACESWKPSIVSSPCVCTHLCLYSHIYILVRLTSSQRIGDHLSMYISICVWECVCACICICMCTCTCTCMCVYMSPHTHTHYYSV